jgi:hypothetical protein
VLLNSRGAPGAVKLNENQLQRSTVMHNENCGSLLLLLYCCFTAAYEHSDAQREQRLELQTTSTARAARSSVMVYVGALYYCCFTAALLQPTSTARAARELRELCS